MDDLEKVAQESEIWESLLAFGLPSQPKPV